MRNSVLPVARMCSEIRLLPVWTAHLWKEEHWKWEWDHVGCYADGPAITASCFAKKTMWNAGVFPRRSAYLWQFVHHQILIPCLLGTSLPVHESPIFIQFPVCTFNSLEEVLWESDHLQERGSARVEVGVWSYRACNRKCSCVHHVKQELKCTTKSFRRIYPYSLVKNKIKGERDFHSIWTFRPFWVIDFPRERSILFSPPIPGRTRHIFIS